MRESYTSLEESVSTTDARADFAEIISRVACAGDRVTIERHGKPLVALVSVERLEELEAIEDAMDGRAAEKVAEEGEFIGEDDFFAPMERNK